MDETFIRENGKVLHGIILFMVITTILFDILALRVISKTKRTPKNSRFLSSGIIVLDCLSLVTVCVRLFVNNDFISYEFMVDGFLFVNTSFLTVTLMCLERAILCVSPILYSRHFEKGQVKKMGITIWVAFPVGFLLFWYGLCNGIFHDKVTYEKCHSSLQKALSAILITNVIVSYVCVLKVFLVIRTKTDKMSTVSPRTNDVPSVTQTLQTTHNTETKTTCDATWSNKSDLHICENVRMAKLCDDSKQESAKKPIQFPHNKVNISIKNTNTYFVFAYLINMTVMLIGVVIVNIIGAHSRFASVFSFVIIILNGWIDPLLYVFWFKECKMHFIKTIAVCVPMLELKAEQMRIEVFHIVTSQAVSSTRKQTQK